MMTIKLFLFFFIKGETDSTCMYKSLFLLLFLLTASLVYGQTDSLSQEDKRLLDSMFKNDEFIKLMMGKERSYVDINIGMGNGIFSLKNNAFNAEQSQTNISYYTPSVGYYHKSGLALSLNSYFANDLGKLKMYQYAVTPGYTYSDKKISAGISYTRYIEGASANFAVNPFKNDFYASARYKKSWIEPGLSLGYSFGKLTDHFDTSISYIPPGQVDPRIIHIRDTITTRLSNFSVTLSVSHVWEFWELISKKDGLQLQPSVMLNAGSQKWDITHSNSLFDRRPIVQYYLKRKFGDGETTASFNVQSVAFSGKIIYNYGKFYLQPQLYLDYYLPETTGKRLTSLFAVTAGVTL
jgi:hypothetical protein